MGELAAGTPSWTSTEYPHLGEELLLAPQAFTRPALSLTLESGESAFETSPVPRAHTVDVHSSDPTDAETIATLSKAPVSMPTQYSPRTRNDTSVASARMSSSSLTGAPVAGFLHPAVS